VTLRGSPHSNFFAILSHIDRFHNNKNNTFGKVVSCQVVDFSRLYSRPNGEKLKYGSNGLQGEAAAQPILCQKLAVLTNRRFIMSTITTAVQAFIDDEDGATAIEYGLIAALIAVAIVASLQSVQTELKALFKSVADNLKL
jgi:pilus assembly protein Flp/PilA